ncbi:MAG: P-loop NTPase [ANME-2 cluster archaeon]|jgi:Mrp family chromosome partitioning ATPase|nr:P-loop NTPase [ANME-2 cluster archaeon]
MDQVKNKKPTDDNLKITENLQKIKYKIMVMSGKGGVGKSTVAVNLAYDLSNRGLDVGLLDADLHGPSTLKMLNIETGVVNGDTEGIFPAEVTPHLKVMSMGLFLTDTDTPVIWRGPVKMGAIRQFLEEVHWGNLDYLIIDLPPGTGDEPLSIAQLIPDINGTVIITTPQDIALLDSKKAVNFAKTLKIPVIGIVENMSGFTCPHCGESIDLFKVGGGENAAHDLDVPFLGRIPLDQKIVEDCDNGTPFVASGDKSESTESFKEIVAKIEDFVN